MNMIEKAARAMCIVEGLDPDVLCYRSMPQKYANGLFVAPNPLMCYPAWTFNVIAARATIETMREPTEAMIVEAETKVVGLACFNDMDSSPAYLAWQAMIDAALKEE